MNTYVFGFQEIDKSKLALVGGKGANLGELSHIKGIQVPEGFCVTTDAYKEIIGCNKEFHLLLEQLSFLKADDRDNIAKISSNIREIIESIAISENIKAEIVSHIDQGNSAYAVRSSATAEDLPTASFAGQQDTYLNVIGEKSILNHISKCWASLFTDRAITYRIQNGFEHSKVYLSVVVQKMIIPEASGIMFTADPITGNRKIVSIDAGFGLGEALVSGLVTADNYKVHSGKIIDKKISAKKLAIYALKEGSTVEKAVDHNRQNTQTLTDGQILELEKTARQIEEHFGKPQDIEWCVSDSKPYILQSRPITTLYPLPENQDGKNRVYMSFGHQQMMTEAMKPLGLSVFRYSGGGDGTFMTEAGGRLFMDITHDLSSPIGRTIVVKAMGKVDPLVDSGLKRLIKRKNFIKSLPHGKGMMSSNKGYFSWSLITEFLKTYRSSNENTVPSLIRKNEVSIKELEKKFDALSGDELFAAVIDELKQLIKIIGDPKGLSCVWTGALSASQINKSVEKWLGEKNVADKLALSAPNSIANEIGIKLLAVSDTTRKYPQVVEYLKTAKPEGADVFFNKLGNLNGGAEVSKSIKEYLTKFGMRCSGDIDITKPRWAEEPTALAAMILSNIENFAPGAHKKVFERDLKEVEDKKRDIVNRLSALPRGKAKVKKFLKMLSRLRNFIGYREYPKYVMVSRYWIVKKALLREAEKLVQCGTLREKEDMYYLSFNELRESVRLKKVDYTAILERKAKFETYEKLTPPRLMTSEGEIVTGEYDSSKAPKGALIGVAASSGVVEGQARIVLSLDDANLSKGDILVTKFTDPSWTPVFVSISALVAEVGGVATHGSVVAREYGLPAVVGVDNATSLIKDGQKIRVNGSDGYIEILE